MLTLISPAKINLFLRIVSKRPDGYHNLASLFQAIDLHDTLHIALDKKDSLTCTDPTIPTDHTNLILKATSLFRKKMGVRDGLNVHLEKRIPIQAGLGGGSSNAATTLWAFNQLTGNRVAASTLAEWSAEIGSDIPFFLSQGIAYCTGRGEVVQTLSSLSSRSFWIVKPEQGLSTPEVYRRLDVGSLKKRDPEMCLEAFLMGQEEYFNDLEEPAFAAMPALEKLKRDIVALGYKPVLLSGSGSSLFCVGEKRPSFPGTAVYGVSTINRSINQWYKL